MTLPRLESKQKTNVFNRTENVQEEILGRDAEVDFQSHCFNKYSIALNVTFLYKLL
jgi:hypothetical protein